MSGAPKEAAEDSPREAKSIAPILPSTWPPIITDAAVPRLTVWRDRLLTLGMWLLLVWLCRHGLIALGQELSGVSLYVLPVNVPSIAERWERLQPYFLVVAVFAAWLLLWALVQVRRRKRVLDEPPPEALSLAEEAARAGCSAADLAAWREKKVCVARLDAQGALSVSDSIL